jgi:hypothetical protein
MIEPRDVPVHYVRSNERSASPRCYVYLDTEAHRAPVDGGERQTWRLACTAHDHRRDGPDNWRDPERARHETPEQLWDWVTARCKVGERCVLVAHNLGYDLRISRAFYLLPALGWHADRVRIEDQSTMIRWRNGKRTLLMVDSLNWIPAPLAAIGDDLGMPKPDLPDEDDSDAAWWARCEADVTILRAAWRHVLAWCREQDCGMWQPSGAAQAWSCWRHRFMTHRVLVWPDADLRALERRACWAGRAEAWRVGTFDAGPYVEWDHVTQYLRIAEDYELPVSYGGYDTRPSLERALELADRIAVLSRCTVTTDVPTVPTELDGRIVWPVGRFDTVLWDCELRMALDAGARVDVHELHGYERAPALSEFARWLTPFAVGETPDVHPLTRRVAKHWSRALIGRFGVRYRQWNDYGDRLGDDVALHHVTDGTTGERFRLLMLADRALREGEPIEGENAVPSLLGYVMAVSRVQLWAAMTCAGLGNVLHVDTDGLIVTPAGDRRLRDRKLPGLRRKRAWSSLEVLGTRQLVLGGQLRIAGVSRASAREGVRTFAGDVWSTLGGDLAGADAGAVTVTARRWVLRELEHRRQVRRDGSTFPLAVGL